ncbi:DUF2625 domain-containing protein [Nocardia sp. NBC_00881]|uniref:DUF2625 family protein n=1 Tax=Nocardia sp. NBC_00881 TaxID=2975995 RepID=UPI00386C3E1C|nr:DUF2625 domain-containing protein [Nocardia sp. NBC_00881]
MRTVSELTEADDPAWPEIHQELASAPVPIKILPVHPANGARNLYALQVSTRSALGALALHTGGVLVDHGWLRVFGGGDPARRMPGLAEVNDMTAGYPPTLLVGVDVIGGRFEINGADPAALGRPGSPGDICYFAPDTLEWEEHLDGHSSWLSWLATGGTTSFYEDLRWSGWAEQTRNLWLDQGFSSYPPLFTQEAQNNPVAISRKVVPLAELHGFLANSAGSR